MESLPAETIRQILQEVGSLGDLASATQVCRYLHIHATPWLYRHTTIDLQHVYTQDDGVSRSEGPLPSCMAQLQGLARNSQGQCQYVQKLSVINESDLRHGLGSFSETNVGFILDGRNGTQFFVNCLLEAAIPLMKYLTELEWSVLAYPSNAIFAALSKHRLCSFTYQWPRNYFSDDHSSLTLDYPSPFNPEIRVLKLENLTSLSLSNIGSNKAADDTADLIFSLRHQLKILRLSPTQRWKPEITYNSAPDEDLRAALDYDTACVKDTLLPFIYHFVVAGEPQPMKLEELELQNMSDNYDIYDWIQAFDFHTIQRFTLINGRFNFGDGAQNLWNYLREQNVSFKALKTDCENEPLDSFLKSFEGLESLFLRDYDKRWSRISDLSLSGHFRSLRKFFYPDCVHGIFFGHHVLRIIANCPLLEELGVFIDGESMHQALSVFDEFPSLRRLYVTSCTLEDHRFDQFNYEDFLREFFSYFKPSDSSFLNRLELLSYYRTLWEIVPIEGNDCEREEMEYELSYEPLSDGELDALGPVLGPEQVREIAPTPSNPGNCGGDSAIEEEEDSETLKWLLQPECYTWERMLSGYNRMPLRVPWIDYRDDEMARTVYEFILSKNLRSSSPWLQAEPPTGYDDWADKSDSGVEDCQLSEWEEEEESEEGEGSDESDESEEEDIGISF